MKLSYYQRIFKAYLTAQRSQLDFWHDLPTASGDCSAELLGPYYMDFSRKARYPGPFDRAGVPMLNYHGNIGLQYNPIAIAQYGLGNLTLFGRGSEPSHQNKALACGDWLVDNLEPNPKGVPVWMHLFDFEYFRTLKAPWYSALAQGQGISLLLRLAVLTGRDVYRECADRAFTALVTGIAQGGVRHRDERGRTWLEEYIVSPPTHILNGFIWALWGVHDYKLATGDERAKELWDESLATLEACLGAFDTGYWSRYDLAPLAMPNLASPFYHRLHITQLEIMHRLSGRAVFARTAAKWKKYVGRRTNRLLAYLLKVSFKLIHY